MSDDAAGLLAGIHAARGLLRATARAAPSPARAHPGIAALWAHAIREPGAAVDLAVVRAIRTDPDTARRYRTLLAAQAVAHAPLAAAAADGRIASRRIGAFTLEFLDGMAEGPPLLVIRGENPRPPRIIEVILADDAVRVALPEPIAGAILLALDPAVPDVVRLGAMLRNPASAAFLL